MIGQRLFLGLGLGAGLAIATDAGAQGAADSGTISCASSGDCSTPTPYCDTMRHSCVECLSDRNCASTTGLCDLAEGVCVPCFSDLDCGTPTPYCSDELNRCVECIADSNCGELGIACADGKCGWCGDGICGPKERLFANTFGTLPGGIVVCPEDCAPACEAAADLGSAMGQNLVTVETEGLGNVASGGCGGFDGPEAWFAWTPPVTGTYWIDAIGSTQATSIYVLAGACVDIDTWSWSCSPQAHEETVFFELEGGFTAIILLDTEGVPQGTSVLNILDHCEGENCPTGPGGGPPGGEPDAGEPLELECLANALSRGDLICAGVECACRHCAQDYGDCAVIPGCAEVSACLRERDCIGEDCYDSGACREVIDAHGGVSGPAFRAGSGLQSCALSFECAFPCDVEAGAPSGGEPDGGQLCEPGRSVECDCDGGVTGQRRCNSDGTAFEACSCGAENDGGGSGGSEDDGCGCRLGGATSQDSAWSLGAALLGLSRLRRTRRRASRTFDQAAHRR